jgi:hypothetical protein
MIVTTGFEKEGNLRKIRARLLRRRQNELFFIPRACSYSSRLLPEFLTSYPTTRKQRQTAISERLSTPVPEECLKFLETVPLLIIDDLGMRKLPLVAAEELLEVVMRRYERASTLLISNRPVEDWGKLQGDAAAVSAMLDRLLHHGHLLKCGPRSWRTKLDAPAK